MDILGGSLLDTKDIVLVSFSVVTLISYHFILYFLVTKYPQKTVIGITRAARHILRKKDYILAVQTCRNTITMTSILSSVTVTLSVAMVAVLTSLTSGNFDVPMSDGKTLITAKITIILTLFFLSFFFFNQTMRMLNHATFLIVTPEIYALEQSENSPPLLNNGASTEQIIENHDTKHSKMFTEDFIANIMNQAGLFQSIALRLMFVSFPFIFFFFGAVHFFVASVVLVSILIPLDLIWH